jgi:predicted alpha/beta superfamily hydrolase
VAAYLERLRCEVLPWVAAAYGASLEPRDLAFGGSSFGAIAALAAALHGPEECCFGSLLVESPSLWIGEESFLQEVLSHYGPWPERIFIGMGGREVRLMAACTARGWKRLQPYTSVLSKHAGDSTQLLQAGTASQRSSKPPQATCSFWHCMAVARQAFRRGREWGFADSAAYMLLPAHAHSM